MCQTLIFFENLLISSYGAVLVDSFLFFKRDQVENIVAMNGRIWWVMTVLFWSGGKAENFRVHRVKAGETVVLPCFSNDDDHRFQYWEIGNDKIVGPWNIHNQNKYKYEVWSGKLVIKVLCRFEKPRVRGKT